MNAFYNIAYATGVVAAILFTGLVLITGKGDAMSGGGSVRTTFKGKASFDDFMSKWTLILGVFLMVSVLVVDVLVNYMNKPA